MKVHDAPIVILVVRPSISWTGVRDLLAEYRLGLSEWQHDKDATDGDLVPELLGRLCYGSFGPAQGRIGSESYLGNILAQGHGSVLEHATWSFVVCRASRGFTHQMVRHRAGTAMSQESTHFIRYGDGGRKGEVEPAVCVTGLEGELRDAAIEGLHVGTESYSRLWDSIKAADPDAKKKTISGAARGLLPTALESRLGFSGNARALRHICEYRGNGDNVLDIRLVAAQLLRVMKVEAPATFQDLVVYKDDDGWPTVGSTLPLPRTRCVIDEEGVPRTVTLTGPKV